MPKNQLLRSFGIFLPFLVLSIAALHGQDAGYALNENESAFVMIQMKETSKSSASDLSEPAVQSVVNQIKTINTKLGYEEFAKKMASFTLDNNGHKITYLTIRNFNDLKAASLYAEALEKDLPKDIFGKIKKPFPVCQTDYKQCVTEKDFLPYYKAYSKTSR